MAERKITFEDIFAEDIFARLATSVAAANDVLKEADATLTEMAKKHAGTVKELMAALPSADNLKKLSDATRQLDASTRALAAVRKQLANMEERAAALRSEEGRALARQRAELRELTKDMNAAAKSELAAAQAQDLLRKATEGTFESYNDLSDTLEKLRVVYKDLAATGKANTEEAAKLFVTIRELDQKIKNIDDSVGQFQRRVGSYTQSIRDVFNEFRIKAQEAGGAVGQTAGLLFNLGQAFRAAGGGLKGMAAGAKALGQSLKSLGIIALLSLLAEGLDKITSKIKDLFSEETARSLSRAKEGLEVMRQRVKLEDEVARAQTARQAAEEDTEELVRAEYEARRQLARLEVQQALRRQSEAERHRRELEEEGAAREEIAKAYEEEAQAIKEVADAERALNALFDEQNRAEREIQKRREEQRREEARRRAEEEAARRRELEALIKQMAVEKEAAEGRVAAAERAAEAERQALRDNVSMAKALARTRDEMARITAAAKAKEADIERRLAAEVLKIRGEAAARIAEINMQAREKGLEGEVEAIRAKYKRIMQEVEEQERELGQRQEEVRRAVEQAARREEADLRRKYALQDLEAQENLAKARLDQRAREFETTEEFEKFKQTELLRLQADFLRRRIELMRQMGMEGMEVEVANWEAALALIELRLNELGKKTETVAKNTLQRVADTMQGIADVFTATMERSFERAGVLIDRRLGMVRRRQDLLIAQIAAGSVAAGESLAELEKQEAELIRQQEALKRQAQRREAALAVFRAYAGQLQQGVNPAQALLNTIRDFQVLAQLIRTLPTFYHGTERVSAATHPRVLQAGRDAFLARVHEGERIVPAEVNKKLEGIPNSALPELVRGAVVSFDADALTGALATVIKTERKTTKIWRSL